MAKSKEPEPEKKLFPGLSLDKILGDIGKELKHQAQHGAHETAALLYNGSAFVMYPHEGQSQNQDQGQQQSNDQGPQHGLPDHTQQNDHER